jgi:2TM domain
VVKISVGKPAEADGDAPADSAQLALQRALKQTKARRRFKISTASAAVGVTFLVPIWAATEYHNAGGWPTCGFSQRSGHKVWNIWIIYPFLAYALITAGHGWFVYARKPIPQSESKRETDCRAAGRRASDP